MGELMRATREEICTEWGTEDGFEGAMDEVASGKSLWLLCQERVWSFRAAVKWIEADAGRLAAYMEAQRLWSVSKAHEGMALVDGSGVEELAVNQARFSARKWMAEKFNPEQFMPRTKHTVERVGDWGERLRRARERVLDAEVTEVVVEGPEVLEAEMDDDI